MFSKDFSLCAQVFLIQSYNKIYKNKTEFHIKNYLGSNRVKNNIKELSEFLGRVPLQTFTFGENIIATTKIRNNYITIQSFIFPIAILDFSLLLLVKLSLLNFFASFLMASILKLSLFQLSRQRQLSLFLALKGDSDMCTFTLR